MKLNSYEQSIILFSMFLIIMGLYVGVYEQLTFDKTSLVGYNDSIDEFVVLCSEPGLSPLVSIDQYYFLTRTNHSVSESEVLYLLNNCVDFLGNVVSKGSAGFSISLNSSLVTN